MNEEYINLANLPGRQGEQTWLWNRLEQLSVWEGKALAALTQRHPPSTAEEMVNRVLALQSCFIYLTIPLFSTSEGPAGAGPFFHWTKKKCISANFL